MNIPTLKTTAAQRLAAASYSPRKLALLHGGVAVALSLVTTLVNLLLTRQMDGTGGLSGIGTRTALSFLQTILMLVTSLALPFWELGFYRAALNLSRREPAEPATLLSGFRRFGAVLRLILLRSGIVLGITFACLQVATILFMLSPWSLEAMEVAEQLLAAGAATPDEAIMEQMLGAIYPVYILFAVLVFALVIPILYRFRLSDFAVMDDAPGALRALGLSSYWMHGKRLWLFRLDLSFWWYYGLQTLATFLAYSDLLLPALGIQLDKDTALLLSGALSAAVQLVTAWRFAPLVQTTYACAYDALRAEKPPLKQNGQLTPNN